MKVKELMKILNKMTKEDKDKEILISIDEEGNDFKKIHEVCMASEETNYDDDKVEGFIIYPE